MTWANLVWLLPFRRQVILVTSPLVVAWVWFLLITSYLYSMDLTPKELPTTYSIFNLKSGKSLEDITWLFNIFHLGVGVDMQSDIKWFHLLAKSLFGVIIFVTMRQLFQARALKKQRQQLVDAVGETEKSQHWRRVYGGFNIESFRFGWLFGKVASPTTDSGDMCAILCRLVDMAGDNQHDLDGLLEHQQCVQDCVCFSGLSLHCGIPGVFPIAPVPALMASFQICPFNFWKKFLRVYWWIVIIYAMANLFTIYLYQISVTRNIMHKYISRKVWVGPECR